MFYNNLQDNIKILNFAVTLRSCFHFDNNVVDSKKINLSNWRANLTEKEKCKIVNGVKNLASDCRTKYELYDKLTRSINLFFKIINSNFVESEHPRDAEGKFTEKGKGGTGNNTHKNKSIEIKGNELGDYKDIKELRQKATEYYKKNLSGTKVYREEIGYINFVNRGLKEFLHFSASEVKLKAIVYIKDIIETGEVKYEELHKIRHDSPSRFLDYY